MIENNLLKTNFIGKDGFRWWIGQVAPEAAQGNQINQTGSTWGCRVKVRIYGYHPADITELADEDLPWAQVYYPHRVVQEKQIVRDQFVYHLAILSWVFSLMVMTHNYLLS